MKRRAFTLMEVLASLTILTLLAVAALPVWTDIVRQTKADERQRPLRDRLDGLEVETLATALATGCLRLEETAPVAEDGEVVTPPSAVKDGLWLHVREVTVVHGVEATLPPAGNDGADPDDDGAPATGGTDPEPASAAPRWLLVELRRGGEATAPVVAQRLRLLPPAAPDDEEAAP